MVEIVEVELVLFQFDGSEVAFVSVEFVGVEESETVGLRKVEMFADSSRAAAVATAAAFDASAVVVGGLGLGPEREGGLGEGRGRFLELRRFLRLGLDGPG
jgi:hypothetical protein